MPKVNINSDTKFILFAVCVFVLLTLSFVNIKNYTSQNTLANTNKVLAAETQDVLDNKTADKFWFEFLSKNPNYVPGWVEIERLDKAYEIDPNYQTSVRR